MHSFRMTVIKSIFTQIINIFIAIYYMCTHRQNAGIDVVRGIVGTSSSNVEVVGGVCIGETEAQHR